MPRLPQVCRQPSQIEIETVGIAKPVDPKQPCASRAQKHAPRHIAMSVAGAPATQQTQLRLIHAAALARIVTVPPVEDYGPQGSDRREYLEDRPPSQPLLQIKKQHRRDRASPAGAGRFESFRSQSFVSRQPGTKTLRKIGKASGFTHAKTKSRDEQGRVTSG